MIRATIASVALLAGIGALGEAYARDRAAVRGPSDGDDGMEIGPASSATASARQSAPPKNVILIVSD
ncbi:MAG TPA: hypothetical protein VE173_05200, partial [Longimicrobiales bacterium]|nr:hypothetical protein [Longimicrobiales bacterium]